MASTTISVCFSPKALAAPKSRTANNTAKPLPNHNPTNRTNSKSNNKVRRRFTPPPQPLPGGDATTYTRLPPKHDVQDYQPPFQSSPLKLSDSTPPIIHHQHQLLEYQDHEDEDEEEEAAFDSNFPGNYRVVEVYEGNASSEQFEEEDDDDEEEEEEEEEDFDPNFTGNYKVLEVFQGNSNFEDDDDEEEDEVFDGKNVNLDEGADFSNNQSGESEEFSEKEEEEAEVKDKGVPAVMRCFDRAKIYVKAGDGGNGVVAFRREKFVPFGGPSGGDGGRGGNVYVEVDGSMSSLLPFRNSIHFRAGRGSHGQGRVQSGAKGEDVVVKVAPGTLIREAGKDEVLLEMVRPGQRALLLPGGRGGRGNASFKSGTNKVPKIAENGEQGPEMWLELELKLVADVGIVGAPNAGKSTLLSVVSAAKPEVANYPFTTLLPNLGVVSFDYDSSMVVADLPGLLEGAHRGFGLGHEFLRHTERCSALVHVVDGSSLQPDLEFDAVRLELKLFNPDLAEKPYIVAYNKMDLPEAYENWESFKEKLQSRGITTFCMSAVKGEGTREVIGAAYELLRKSKDKEEYDYEDGRDMVDLNHVADAVLKQRNASINEFEIFHNSESNIWHVVGSGLQRFVQMTNWRYVDSDKRFQHVLEACGVYKSLMKRGVKEGDIVMVGEMEMVWHDSSDNNSGASRMKKTSTDSIKWPEWK
ncbi:hypothetical protein RIF29_40543 [Crotalaria pallida]|uniref:GTP-binding protein OBGC, chloroplastic n=1 Tax=Crotalaria pallida TaxID=3830 RepID=A0AAN9E3P8_CROPI